MKPEIGNDISFCHFAVMDNAHLLVEKKDKISRDHYAFQSYPDPAWPKAEAPLPLEIQSHLHTLLWGVEK